MIKPTTILCALLTATGCDDGGGGRQDDEDDEGGDPLPSAPLDDRGKTLTAQFGPGAERPCGFTDLVETETPEATDNYLIIWTVTYEGEYDVRQEGTDEETGAPYATDVLDHDGAGNVTYQAYDYVDTPDEPDYQWWATFDPSGNRLTYAGDDDADPDEEWRATYDVVDGRPTTAQMESWGPATPWSRTYHYDGDRLSRVETDDRSDGTIDKEMRLEYDDDAGVILGTTTDPSGAVVQTRRLEYDDQDRLVLETDTRGPYDWGKYTYTRADEYDPSGLLLSQTFENVYLDADDQITDRDHTTRDYRFGEACE